MMEHTKGKLTVIIGNRRGWFVRLACKGIDILAGVDTTKAKSNAQRLVLCWNEHNKLKEQIAKLYSRAEHYKELDRLSRLEADGYLKCLDNKQKEVDSLKAKADVCDELVEALEYSLKLIATLEELHQIDLDAIYECYPQVKKLPNPDKLPTKTITQALEKAKGVEE